jgi:undecaprenyl-diphosphatase
MFEYIILGVVQGIAEWLPISSEGTIILVREVFFPGDSILSSISIALFLHLGTFLAVLVYFWRDVKKILLDILHWKKSKPKDRSLIFFLLIATLISGILGLVLLYILGSFEEKVSLAGSFVMGLVGILLLITGVLQLKARESDLANSEPNQKDALLLGIVQGFAALPGLSRSGLTVSALLLRKYSKEEALRLSFLLSLPIVLGGNIILNLSGFAINAEKLVGLLFSFIFGLATIHALIILARKINFGWFVIVFGLLSILAAFI